MENDKPSVVVVIGGGGLKSFAAIPLLSFLEQQQIDINLLVGCSGGSVASGLYAFGYSPDEIEKKILPSVRKSFFRPNYRALLAYANLPYGKMDRSSAFFSPKPLMKFARQIFGDATFADLKIKTVFQATDFETGESVCLDHGDLASAVYASSAIYPFLPPIKLDGRWMLDGLYSAPIPILQAIKQNPDLIIVVDFLEKLKENPTGPMETMMHLSKMYAKTIIANQNVLSVNLSSAEIIWMKVKFDHYLSIWDVDKFPLIHNAGQKALDSIKEELMNLFCQADQKHITNLSYKVVTET